MNPPNIKLHIDRLVLRGIGADVDRERLGAAVRQELTRLFAEEGVSPSIHRDGHAARVDGGAFHLVPGTRAETIGGQIARAVYAGIGQRPPRDGVAALSAPAARRSHRPRPLQDRDRGSFNG